MSKFTERAQRKKIVAKIVMLGDGAVGKTALVRRFMKQSFDGAYKITMGLDLSLKEINLPETTVGIQLWDMGGQVAFRSLRSRFYQGSRCAVLVYDVTRPQTFENLDEWRQELKENIQEEIPFVVLGNKNDLQDLILVSEEDEKNWAENA
ncbi:MAG: Rab family GTPase, partial [Promethearchaeota archaeon]